MSSSSSSSSTATSFQPTQASHHHHNHHHQQQQQQQQQQHQQQQQRLRLPLPSPPLPPGVPPTRVQWLQTAYADPSHHPHAQPPQQQQQRYVLYWMQRSVRSSFNHALECAIHHANHLDLPLLVVFCFLKTYPGANERGFAFLLEGLSEVQALLARRGIRMTVREAKGSVPQAVLDTARRVRAPLLVTDRGYERILRAWRREVAAQSPCPVLQVESDVVVPVETATGGRALNATAAFRAAQAQHLKAHLVPLPEGRVLRPSIAQGEGATAGAAGAVLELPDEFDVRDPEALLASLDAIDRSVKRVPFKRGGGMQAKALLARFLRDKLAGYATHRKEAYLRHQSFLSPYLHFGHISALYVALKVKQHTGSSAEDRRRFLDEMLCWREMAVHFVYHHPDNYDNYSVLPVWARDSLHEHQGDARNHMYTLQELEEGRTHDPLWNAAQLEMVVSGYMNNYLRMLWCKLIIAWTPTPQEAYRTALMLNDKYFLDGRDCNGYMGVAWCFGSLDRPMPVSPIYGKIRRMTSSGARNKMDVDAYIAQVRDLALKARGPRAQALGIADHTYATPLRTTINAFFNSGGSAASAALSSSLAATPVAARALQEEGDGGGGRGKRPAAAVGAKHDGEDGQGKKPKKKGGIVDYFAAKKKA